ncbi:helix-turn-helix transcriptional regulator [Pseudoalteromonas sp. MMG013]|uniref:helix-turn-helix domain-containing protein n=1 Tax=Pseudoalteromonas sp. MMG013 TaxID=2822687 RepID=UPI001B3770DD|nr:AraC family transcriptional regulator [Pseudoalteromonas sp. MMG013]MBQ4860426.1 helix-turn-helix transcriptional regulator [Pseudoalteromonas sp. MMG013]
MRQLNTHSKPSSGVYHANKSTLNYNLKKYQPSENLKRLVDCYWFVSWQLECGATWIQRNLPSPNMHLIFDQQSLYCTGVMTHAYETPLQGSKTLIGVKFRVGALNTILPYPHQELQNLHFNSGFLFDECQSDALHNTENHQLCITTLNQLLSHLPQPDNSQEKMNRTWQILANNPTINTVDQWAKQSQLSVRTLQRLCIKHIGLAPKWLLRKQRCIHALQLLEEEKVDIYDVITLLGLTDQAHLIKEFKKILGLTPNQYLKL